MNKFYLIITLLVFISCNNSYIKQKLSQKNPTFYVFNASIGEIKNVVKEHYIHDSSKKMRLYFFSDKHTLSILQYLNIKRTIGDNNDAILYASYHKNLSNLYYKDNKPLGYSAYFHVHLTELEKYQTKIEIITYKPTLLLGEKFYSKIFNIFGHSFFNTEEVEPSSIEEYQILLDIGEGLGVKDKMPKIIMPLIEKL